MKKAIGIDIGGTKVAIGIVDEAGHILAKKVIATDLSITPSEMIGQICSHSFALLASTDLTGKDIYGIGIGAPGPLDAEAGVILNPPNLPNWRDIPVVTMIEQTIKAPTFLENDANAATLAEKWVGAAQNLNHFVYMTISTGIGAGIYENGKLVKGKSGNAGDIGHIVIDPSFGECVCGQSGCFEWIASGTAIARQGTELIGRKVTAQEVFELCEQGDPAMTRLVNTIFEKIGVGCVSIINALDPEKIIIGGGVSHVGEPLFAALRQHVRKVALNLSGRKTEVIPTGLQHDTGLLGAAAIVFKGDRGNV